MLGMVMEDGLGGTSLGDSLSVEGSPTARHPLLGLPRRELLEAPSGFPASLPPAQWLFLSMTSENKFEALQCHFILYSLHKSRQNGSELSQRCLHLHLRLPQPSFPHSWDVDPSRSTCLVSVKALGSISTTDRKHSHAPLIHSVFLTFLSTSSATPKDRLTQSGFRGSPTQSRLPALLTGNLMTTPASVHLHLCAVHENHSSEQP